MKADVFCTPQIYENAFFETDQFLAVYNARPIIRGHSLIIPKRHVTRITELSAEELAEFRKMLELLLPKLLKAFDADSYNLSINAGEHAGMVINHLHVHVIPRGAGDPMQGKLLEFCQALNNDRGRYIKGVNEEVARLRRIFKYTRSQTRL